MGVFAALTNLAGAVGCPLGGYLCDKYFRHKMPVLIVICLIVAAVFTYLAANAPTGEWAAACLVVVFLSMMGIGNTATFTLPLVLVPRHATGGAFGIVNTAGQVAGILSPLLIGELLTITHGNFRVVLYSMVGVSLAAVIPALKIRQPSHL
jgi:nitrate/nitrite transporter NarK